MRTHAVKWGLLVTVAALCFVGYAGVQGALGVMEGWTKNLPSIEDTDFTNTSRESVMYAGDEATLLAEFQLEKRDPVTYEEISPYVLEGTVDTEDVRFYEHEGVDIPGIARAFVNNLRGGDLEGASTITQHLAGVRLYHDLRGNPGSAGASVCEAAAAEPAEGRKYSGTV